jgi:tol-pal system protein YbgF
MRTKLMAACLLIALSVGPAYPQNKDILQLQADMIRLSQQVKQLQTSVDQNNAALKGLVEKMSDQVNTVAAGMQQMTQALVDSVKSQGDKTSSELRGILTNFTSLNNSLTELQEGLSSVRAQINSISQQVTTMKTTTVEPLAGPDDLMRSAMVDYLAGNYELAISGFQEFLSKYPNDPRAADAQLSRGEALFNQKKYDLAVIEYDLFLQKFPQSDKTRTALYKKGLAQSEQNDPQAVTTLNRVVKEFPGTSEATNAQQKVRDLGAAQRRPAR